MGKHSANGRFRTTVTIDNVVFEAGMLRAEGLYRGNFSAYVEALVEIDVKERPDHVITRSSNGSAVARKKGRSAAEVERAGGAIVLFPPATDAPRPKVDFWYENTLAAGHASGVTPGNAPKQIELPLGFTKKVDFVVPVSGPSMTGVIEDGEWAACLYSRQEMPRNNQVVVVLIKGELLIKRFKQIDGKTWFFSENKSKQYKPIAATPSTHVQGFFVDVFPKP